MSAARAAPHTPVSGDRRALERARDRSASEFQVRRGLARPDPLPRTLSTEIDARVIRTTVRYSHVMRNICFIINIFGNSEINFIVKIGIRSVVKIKCSWTSEKKTVVFEVNYNALTEPIIVFQVFQIGLIFLGRNWEQPTRPWNRWLFAIFLPMNRSSLRKLGNSVYIY